MKVEKGIPFPRKYPFDQMAVGDSFAIPSEVHRTTVSVAANRYGVKHGMKFVIRMVADRTHRCWRIE